MSRTGRRPTISGERPFRAVTYWPLGDGRRLVIARHAAKTREGLEPARLRAEGACQGFDWWEVRPIPELAEVGGAAPVGSVEGP